MMPVAEKTDIFFVSDSLVGCYELDFLEIWVWVFIKEEMKSQNYGNRPIDCSAKKDPQRHKADGEIRLLRM